MIMTKQDITVLVATSPHVILLNNEAADELFAHIEQEVKLFEHDLTTDKGRKATKAFAYKIARTKTAIDDAGVLLLEDANKKIKLVNVERKKARDRLDALRDKARAPLNEWEDKENKRITRCMAQINEMRLMGVIAATATVDEVQTNVKRMTEIIGGRNNEIVISEDAFEEFYNEAVEVSRCALDTVSSALLRLKKEEVDRAELEQLRADKANRERVDAEKAEQVRVEQEKAEQERVATQQRLEQEAAAKHHEEEIVELARQQEAKKAEDVRKALKIEHAEQIAKSEKEKQDILDAQKRDEENAQRAKEEEAYRTADFQHRRIFMTAASTAIVTVSGITEKQADIIILAIVAGQVANVALKF